MLLLLHAAIIPLPGFLQDKLLSIVIGAIPVGAIVFLLYQQVKRATTVVDGLSPWQHRAAVALIATGLTALGAALHVPIICAPDVNCLTMLDQDTLTVLVKAALAAGMAFLLHAKKDSGPADA